jgi:heme/copper-type cytochrome/quinol oxidase subunit 2
MGSNGSIRWCDNIVAAVGITAVIRTVIGCQGIKIQRWNHWLAMLTIIIVAVAIVVAVVVVKIVIAVIVVSARRARVCKWLTR